MKVLRKQISWAAVWSKDNRANKPETRGDKRAGRGQCTGNELAFWHCPLFSFVQLARFFFLRLNGPRGPYVIAVFRREWTKQLINAIVNKTFYRWTLSRQEPSSKRHVHFKSARWVASALTVLLDTSHKLHRKITLSDCNFPKLTQQPYKLITMQWTDPSVGFGIIRFVDFLYCPTPP